MELRPPSPRLSALIRAWIEACVPSQEPGAWPQRFARQRGLLLLHGNQAWLWFLDPAGRVLALDTDDVAQRLEPESNGEQAVNAVAQAERRRPELQELLPERPAGARACEVCQGSGQPPAWGLCRCAGLGWLA